ncbi:MAG: 2OG-Fe(II) oxygenase [Gammaproteobacteria bacterium]|nr:2OG-Fe(II) oxygenase [Gammaproteobacteria bacterium]
MRPTGYQLHEIRPTSLIYEIRNALGREVCQRAVDRFESNPEQQYPGRIGQGQSLETSIKRSTDLRISGRQDWQDIDNALFDSLSAGLGILSRIHPYFAHNEFRDEGYNLQRTSPGEHYHWHVDSGPGEFSQRQLVAIWYLNDVLGPGGETEFLLQDIAVQPELGKLLLFPPFWTHVHRGKTVERGVKYIATTWVRFV